MEEGPKIVGGRGKEINEEGKTKKKMEEIFSPNSLEIHIK